MRMKATWTLACLVLALAATPRCESDGGSPVEVPSPPDCTGPGCKVASVQVGPTDATVYEGLSIKFTATARDAGSQVVTGVTFQWEVSDPALAEIDASGRLRGKEAGIVQVRATANGKTGSVSLEVVDADVASLELVAPSSLIVNETALLTVTARNTDGAEVPTPALLQWASSDPAIASIDFERAPVVRALRRGTATITVTDGSVEASGALSVRARVVLARPPFGHFPSAEIAIGDDLPFVAYYADVNGETLDESPAVTWVSSSPHVASVSSTGRVIGLRTGRSTITARNSESVGMMEVHVTDVVAGLPARLRLAHGAGLNGPLTFVTSQGASITLMLGESVDLPIRSGTFDVRVDGLQRSDAFPWMSVIVRGGDRLAVFGTDMGPAGAWAHEVTAPADSGLIRFVQGTDDVTIVALQWVGAAPMPGRLIACYFDPQDATEYVPVPAGELDVIVVNKGPLDPSRGVVRRIAVPRGRVVTYVITGESAQTRRLVAFPGF